MVNETTSRPRKVATTGSGLTVPMPVILFALIVAVLCGGAGMLMQAPFLLAGAVPLLICGFLAPQSLLIIAIGLTPFSASITGEGNGAAFGISDVLLLFALPGLIVYILRRIRYARLGPMAAPTFLYLLAGILSFLLNISAMGNNVPSYLVAFFRTVQIVLILPISFAVLPWTGKELRRTGIAYMIGAVVLAVIGIGAFIGGTRSGLYVAGNHKNLVGLALAIGTLFALSALLTPIKRANAAGDTPALIAPEPIGIGRTFLMSVIALCLVGLVCSLSRGAYLGLFAGLAFLTIVRRQLKVFVGILVAGAAVFILMLSFLPEESSTYVTDIKADRESNTSRIDQVNAGMDEFKTMPILGDGFRARRDIIIHNSTVNILVENGVVGFLFFAMLMVAQIRTMYRAVRYFAADPLREWLCLAFSTTWVCVLVQAQFDPYWRRGPVWLPWVGSGLILAMIYQEQALARSIRILKLESSVSGRFDNQHLRPRISSRTSVNRL